VQYIVTSRVVSRALDPDEPVNITWYQGTSLPAAMGAMAQAAARHEDNDPNVPASVRTKTLDVHLAIREDDLGLCIAGGADHVRPHEQVAGCDEWLPLAAFDRRED
jgi:hypothetical protein